jgi:hypothetical protein
MKNHFVRPSLLVALALGALTGCQSMAMDNLKTISAGYTGCTPEQITIQNVTSRNTFTSPGETWNATCNGKVYLCSGVGNSGGTGTGTYSCAVVAK